MAEDRDLLLSQIGMRLLRRRQELGWTQKDLAERLGIGQANVYRIEHGQKNLTIDTLCKLAEALDTTVAELITGKPADDAVTPTRA